MSSSQPTYPLERVQELVRAKRYRATGTAAQGAGDLGLDEDDVVDCVCALRGNDFHKTMEAEQRPGFWQDVYRTTHAGFAIYLKVQLEGKHPDEMAVVISFKRR